MIPTMILFGLVLGRWWPVTLLVAAFGWPALLVATDVVSVNAGLIAAAALALVNAGVGVLIYQGLFHAYRRFHRPASTGVPR
ncbi:hypothetical protein [Intrasporangium sp. DVR]|uniref:hypothetical protein n=1 Tax=Intrasporangium sp. DVR TaxID=3127867 RepID=UPI00313A55DE